MHKIVYCQPYKPAEIIEIDESLEAMQEHVGGYIQAIYPWSDPVALICNDNSIAMGLAPCRYIRDYGIILGNCFVIGLGGEDFRSLPDDLADKYLEMFSLPEDFLRMGNNLYRIRGKKIESILNIA